MDAKNSENKENNEFNNPEFDIIEVKIPAGLPQSVIGRLLSNYEVQHEVKKDEITQQEYPVLFGFKKNVEEAMANVVLYTEMRFALRDIARLSKFHKIPVKLYSKDENVQHILSVAIQDCLKADIEIINTELDQESEIIKVLDNEIYVYI
ncbi:hypothetical protein [Methanococcus voltae]|uniref:Uncharacterized protein n=2 Tax=Methanococcus voltae TaxID=2188 RepID=A0A8J7URD7_METVO|nr:hypothetical protein [Methanococcus voltae]MBP2172902.1 hypothetical protein [Methanococcus voltae]MBP2201688.1 hypothetical protein [Methanococcus voltae]MCS3922476.1 hypothetical protein [Methanococcus voltae PS]